MTNATDVLLGAGMRALRVENGIDVDVLANLLGATTDNIYAFEAGEIRFTPERLLSMTTALNVSVNEIITAAEGAEATLGADLRQAAIAAIEAFAIKSDGQAQ